MAKTKSDITDQVTTFSQCRTTSFLSLGDDARKEFEKTCRFLIAKGTLRSCDLPLVASYAQAQIDIRTARKSIDDLGMVLKGIDRYGNPKYDANPAVKIRRDAEKRLESFALTFGITPLGKKRLKGEEPPKKTASEEWDEQND
jgi:P27 family predicted phage terminase small subunit